MSEGTEIVIDIANLSFTIGNVEEVGLSKIYTDKPYKMSPDAYSVSWSEWIKDEGGDTLKVKSEPQVYKVKKFQKFINGGGTNAYEKARLFFIKKVDEISKTYDEESFKK